jgi:hypothetical protein
MKKTISLLALASLLALTACDTIAENGKPGFSSPKPFLLNGLPQGNDNYSEGFRDGCHNAIGHNGFGMQRIFTKPPRAQDELYMDALYRRGYRDGDRHCGVYVNHDITL